MDDRVQLYKVQVAATMELCGKIVWQRMAHVARPVQWLWGDKMETLGVSTVSPDPMLAASGCPASMGRMGGR